MIQLWYRNNLHKDLVYELELCNMPANAGNDILKYILDIFHSHDCPDAIDAQKLYIQHAHEEIHPLRSTDVLKDGDAIFYLAIIALSNAYEYGREDGIRYFFHTSEQGHQNHPHIHARCGEDEISIYFSDFHVIGKMKSPVIQSRAVRYVKNHLSDMCEKWNDYVPSLTKELRRS